MGCNCFFCLFSPFASYHLLHPLKEKTFQLCILFCLGFFSFYGDPLLQHSSCQQYRTVGLQSQWYVSDLRCLALNLPNGSSVLLPVFRHSWRQSKPGEDCSGERRWERGKGMNSCEPALQPACCFLCWDGATNLISVPFHKGIYCVTSASLSE